MSRFDAAAAPPGREVQFSEAPSPDARLVASARSGDEVAFRQLYQRHHAFVAGMVWRLTRRNDAVDDLVQETFVAVFESLDSLRDPERLRPWVGVICGRVVGRRLDRERRRRKVASALKIAMPDRESQSQAEATALFSCLDGVPSKLRTPWILARIEGERLETVAELCDCSLATVKRRIAAAQQEIERRFGR